MRVAIHRVLVAILVSAAVVLSSGHADGQGKGDERLVRIAIVGDILFDRGVREQIERTGVDALLDGVAPLLSGADLALANLECPLSRRGLRAAKPFSFRGDPECASALARAGLDAVSLANNHSLDYGRGALVDTMTALESSGVVAVGAGMTRAEALEPRVFERNGIRIAVLGYCDLFIEGNTPRDDAPGVATGDPEALLRAIRSARESSQIVVLLIHWGVEYRDKPTDAQRDLARRAMAAGATVVAGAHPHVLQPIEQTGRALVAYSLGNFVFDQRRRDGSDSAILMVTVSATGVERFEAVPVVIHACRPAVAIGEDRERIARRLAPM